jgi:putative peptidoglycan lipid II flippase
LLAGLIFLAASYPLLQVVTGFGPEQLTLVYCLFLETLPIAFLVLWSNLLAGVLNAHHRFAQPQISLGSRSLVIILMIAVLKNPLGVHAIPAAYIIGEAVRTILLFVSLSRAEGLTIRFCYPNRTSFDFFKIASIQIMGVTVLSFNPMVNKAMASWLAEGSVSLLEYAFKLFFIPATILGEGLLVVTLSYWSQQRYEGGAAALRSDVVRTVSWIGLLAAVVGFGFFVLRHEFTGIFYGWGSFPKTRVPDLGEIFGMYILGLPAYLGGMILLRALIVLKDTKSIAKIAALKGVLNVLCNYVFILLIGLKGIALSTSVVEYLGALGLYLYFCKTCKLKRGLA